MGRDPRAEDDDAEDVPLSVDSAIRAAKTAALLGRAPTPDVTKKIQKFDLDRALEKSRDDEGKTDEATPAADRDARSAPRDE